MLKKLKNKIFAFFRPEPENWEEDPLSHPDLLNMSLNALADLPLEPPPAQKETLRAVNKKKLEFTKKLENTC